MRWARKVLLSDTCDATCLPASGPFDPVLYSPATDLHVHAVEALVLWRCVTCKRQGPASSEGSTRRLPTVGAKRLHPVKLLARQACPCPHTGARLTL